MEEQNKSDIEKIIYILKELKNKTNDINKIKEYDDLLNQLQKEYKK